MGLGKRKQINSETFCEFFATALSCQTYASELQIVTYTQLNM